MGLINKGGNVYHLSHDHDEKLHVEKHWQPNIVHNRNWDTGPNDFYYIFEFRQGEVFDTIDLLKYIDNDYLLQLKQPNSSCHLVLSNTHEAFLYVIKHIYSGLVERYGIYPGNIILITGAFEAVQEVERVSRMFHNDSIKLELGMDFEYAAHCDLHYLLTDRKKTFMKTLQNKHEQSFLNLNRRWRAHRPMFVALLKANNLLHKGLVSFGPSDDNKNWEGTWHILDAYTQSYPETYELLNKHKKEIISMKPMYLDTEELVTNRARASSRDSWMYARTYFSLVSETHYFKDGEEHGIFFSEKLFKPIMFKHPFILIAPRGSLAATRSLGYKTFRELDLIDESYDNEEDDIKRMLMIIKETERLSNVNGEALDDWLRKAQSICEYNFNLLWSKQNFYHKLNY